MISLSYTKHYQFSYSVMSNSLQPHGLQHARLPCPSPTSGACSISCPLVGDAVQPSHLLCSLLLLLQSSPGSGSFPVSWLFTSGDQSIAASASALILLMNIQNWFPLGFTGLVSFPVKGLSRVFSSITIQRHQFFSAQSSLWSNTHICTWLLEKSWLWLYWTFV